MVRRRLAATLAIVGVLALGAGCDVFSDDDPTPTTGTSATTPAAPAGPTAAEYRESANRSCRSADERIGQLENPANPTDERVAAVLEEGLGIQQDHIDELKALDPPAALEARHNRAVSLLEQRQSVTQDLLERVEAGESEEGLAELQPQILRLRSQGEAAAQALGLDDCVDTAGAVAGTTTTSGDGSSGTPLQRYRTNVTAAGRAIAQFAALLQNDQSFASKVDRLETNLDRFDENIADLGEYQLSNARLENQRAGIARTGPKVSDVLRRFLEATTRGDEDAIRGLAPEVRSVLSEFQSVVTEGG